MISSFIFCLLAMCYIVSANSPVCPMKLDISGVPCRIFCLYNNGSTDLILEDNGTACKTHGRKPGKCKDGECIQKQ
uniref:Putative salivary kunitz domain protein n=1 Tax=Ixodes ricinus TaxID=34613 RepID=A0A0K8R8I0_IXORI